MLNKHVLTGLFAVALTAVTAVPGHASGAPVSLLGETRLPTGLRFAGTTVGGLSGVDYDPRTRDWTLISDDRSQQQPARFYTAKMDVAPSHVGPLRLTGAHPLLRPDGSPYPPDSADPEEIRFDPRGHDVWWTSEGARAAKVLDPSVRAARPDGSWRRELPLAPNLRMSPHSGARENAALEAMTFAARGSQLVHATEGPLVQDGDSPTTEHGALSRITTQSRSGAVLSQFAYPLDEVFAKSPSGKPGDNGISSILSADPDDPSRLLVLERSFVSGVGNSVRIYSADTRGATDVREAGSLVGANVRPVHKHLVADLSRVGLDHVDNVEGITWGPRLPDGRRTVTLVSDDNFSPKQVTQLITLAVR